MLFIKLGSQFLAPFLFDQESFAPSCVIIIELQMKSVNIIISPFFLQLQERNSFSSTSRDDADE